MMPISKLQKDVNVNVNVCKINRSQVEQIYKYLGTTSDCSEKYEKEGLSLVKKKYPLALI